MSFCGYRLSIVISVCMLTSLETEVLRGLLDREMLQFPAPEHDISRQDIVQIHPHADRTFGGMLVVVTAADPYSVRGYLLRPHRGGCREAWLTWHYSDVERVGRTHWPDLCEFARRHG